MTTHEVVSKDKWVEARKRLLVKEKEFTHMRDQLSAERRELPWLRIDKDYTFDGPNGRETLAQLFGDRSQFVVYDFMFASEWDSPRGLLQRLGFDASPGKMRAPVVCIAECSRSSSPDSIASSAQKCRSGCASVLTKDEVRSSEAARCRDPYRPSWQHEHAADLRRRRLSKVVSTDGSGLASLAAVPEITNTGVHSHPDNAE